VRITDRMIYDRSSLDIARAREATDTAQELVSSGRRVTQPGDDPTVAGVIAAFQVSSARNAALARSADLAAQELGAADGALSTVGNVLARARELAVQFASDAYPADQRTAGATEVGALLQTAIASLNAKFGNRYVLGGRLDGAPPFDATGAYHGDTGPAAVRQVEVAPGVLQDASIRADVAVQGANGGVDVLATLKSLQAALAANDVTGVRNALDPLDGSIAQIANARAEGGVAADALAAASQAGKMAAEDGQVQISHLADVDLPEASVRLAQAQTALQASMSAAAQSFRLTLLDYLK
jgi:flagellar hook-associated protein 3 FlgL